MNQESNKFPETQWSTLDRIKKGEGGEKAFLNDLCERYYRPLFLHALSKGIKKADAEDLTQGFFEMLLNKKAYLKADGTRGKFRTFLLTAFNNYISNVRRKANSQKRGGEHYQVDFEDACVSGVSEKERYSFDMAWAEEIIKNALDRVESHYYKAPAKKIAFDTLSGFVIPWESPVEKDVAAKTLGLSSGAFKLQLHRFRKRFKEAVIQEIKSTLDQSDDMKTELRYLLSLWEKM